LKANWNEQKHAEGKIFWRLPIMRGQAPHLPGNIAGPKQTARVRGAPDASFSKACRQSLWSREEIPQPKPPVTCAALIGAGAVFEANRSA